MPESGYYRTSSKAAKARTARIKERRAAAATPEGREATKKRLLAKKKTREAGMTKQQIHAAERKREREFEARSREPVQGFKKPKKPVVKPSIGWREKVTRGIGLGPVLDALTPDKKKGTK